MDESNRPGSFKVERLCPSCRRVVREDEPTTTCQICGSPHHAECWQKNSACANLHCAAARPAHPILPNSCQICGYVYHTFETECPRCAA